MSGQIIATCSRRLVTPNGRLVRDSYTQIPETVRLRNCNNLPRCMVYFTYMNGQHLWFSCRWIYSTIVPWESYGKSRSPFRKIQVQPGVLPCNYWRCWRWKGWMLQCRGEMVSVGRGDELTWWHRLMVQQNQPTVWIWRCFVYSFLCLWLFDYCPYDAYIRVQVSKSIFKV